jgi:hypothetical protein
VMAGESTTTTAVAIPYVAQRAGHRVADATTIALPSMFLLTHIGVGLRRRRA